MNILNCVMQIVVNMLAFESQQSQHQFQHLIPA